MLLAFEKGRYKEEPPLTRQSQPLPFAPVAIVGRSCLLPGIHTPEALWDAVIHKRDLLTEAPSDRWRMPKEEVLCPADGDARDRAWSARGGYVQGFEDVFDPSGFALGADLVQGLDPLFQWSLHTAREALKDAGYLGRATNAGVVLGNLSFPTASLARWFEGVWLARQDGAILSQLDLRPDFPIAHNRFSSGLPALLIAQALGLERSGFALDAACASSLYAIKLACDDLQEGRADMMLAGAVNCADDLFIHVGFCALQALSRTGQSRPFHREADGLVPGEGAGFVVLKRLEDAERDGDTIHGVIRGIGLSNDGRSKGFLAPSSAGQQAALWQAYERAGLSPQDVSYVECHATGTPVGDATELESMAEVFADLSSLPLGSLKSNIGHLITAAGLAGLIKLTEAMSAQTLPPTLHLEASNHIVEKRFAPVFGPRHWEATDGVRRAGLSAFGFGGNNAHLIVESHNPERPLFTRREETYQRPNPQPIAIVAIGAKAGQLKDKQAFTKALLTPPLAPLSSAQQAQQTKMHSLDVSLKGLRFPPNDLEHTLPQQIAMLEVAREAMDEAGPLKADRTGVLIGMGVDPEICRYGMRWRLRHWARQLPQPWRQQAQDQVMQSLEAAGVVGTMPNIPANRLNSQFDLAGPSFTVSAEEHSGHVAQELAMAALQRGELDAVLIGAVDFSCEHAHQLATQQLLPQDRQPPGDAAFAMVLKRLDDAEREGDKIYAVLARPEEERALHSAVERATLGLAPDAFGLTERFGHPHAASAMLHTTAAALSLHHKSHIDGRPWLTDAERHLDIKIDGIAQQRTHLRVKESPQPLTTHPPTPPLQLHCYAGKDLEQALQHMDDGKEGTDGPARIVIVAADKEQHKARQERARQTILNGAPSGEGVHISDRAIEGEMAFVFTGAGAAYKDMGRALLSAFPQLTEALPGSFASLPEVLNWAYTDDSSYKPSVLDKLWGASALCQLHALCSTELLKLKPDATIGYSSGESNALFAMGVWNDLDEMIRTSQVSGLFDQQLGGDFSVLQASWGEESPTWEVWTTLASEAEVQEAIAENPRVHLMIVHTPNDCVIGGAPEACAEVVKTLGRQRCARLEYDLVVHTPAIEPAKDAWLQLHRRPTSAPHHDVRMYTNATHQAFSPDTEGCAQAIYGQANKTLRFPQTIERAYADGVRIFIEHGPQSACSRWIREILGEREALVVSYDRKGKGIRQLYNTVAALLAASVPIEWESLQAEPADKSHTPAGMVRSFPTHAPDIQWQLPTYDNQTTIQPQHTVPEVTTSHDKMESQRMSAKPTNTTQTPTRTPAQTMAPAPWLPPVMGASAHQQEVLAATPPAPKAAPPVQPKRNGQHPHATHQAPSASNRQQERITTPVQRHSALDLTPQANPQNFLQRWQAYHTQIHQVHQQFIEQQSTIQQHFLQMRSHQLQGLQQVLTQSPSTRAYLPQKATPPAPASQHRHTQGVHFPQVGAAPVPTERAPQPKANQAPPHTRPTPVSAPQKAPAPQKVPAPPTPQRAKPSPQVTPHTSAANKAPQQPKGPTTSSSQKLQPQGLCLTREQLEIHASGKISEIYGPLFAQQDGYERQVRMPEPPLLLADRMTGIVAEPGVLGKGTLWTETDVKADSWYLNDGYMPAGIMIESGQADLMLISYMGIDFLNKSNRIYRLLGCELTYRGDLPSPGETLVYDIHIDGHAKTGDIRLFFFHYDCHVAGQPRLRVRHGEAGFFTDEELANSAGILWKPEEQELAPQPRLDPPVAPTDAKTLTREQIEACAQGRPWEAFGPSFHWAKTHTRTPHIQEGQMLFLDQVTVFEPETGGPWKRGYLKVEKEIQPDDWYFDGHFKNDPCMPGTLMFEGCVQAMSLYMIGLGLTLKRDGWRFQPVLDEPVKMRCRGQVTPTSKHLTYEIFVEEVHDGPIPTVYADLLCTVDGLGAFHARRMGLQLVPDWPLNERHPMLQGPKKQRQSAESDGFKFDYASLLACAWGRPSEAFGPVYEVFDNHRTVARLPGPPYHFMSNIKSIDGPMAKFKSGVTVEVEYDVPEDAWYFHENGTASMPFCVLLEAALQPCGWLASYVGSTLTTDQDLSFRNLDGTGTLHKEVFANSGTLITRSTCTNISSSAGMIIESFKVECLLDGELVYEMDTVFGFFPLEALANQVGLSTKAEQKAVLTAPSDFLVDLTERPERYVAKGARLPSPMLLMFDRVDGFWPEGGEAGLGRMRAVKDIDPDEWFFKAHFFQDPVQPGSLGIEAMLELLQFYMLEVGMDEGIENPRFEPVALGTPMTWKYRGQVLHTNKQVHVTLDILERDKEGPAPYVTASSSLWVDGMRIYEASPVGMRIVSDQPPTPKKPLPQGEGIEVLDPAHDTWLKDHCPTWTAPALPMMSMVDRLAAATPQRVIGMRNVKVSRWLDLPEARVLRTQKEGQKVTLFARLKGEEEAEIATGTILTGSYPTAPEALPPLQGEAVALPYETGQLFHGPAFQLMRSLTVAPGGASFVLDASEHDVPFGRLHQALLDAATHGIPHDALHLWSDQLPADKVAYPCLITELDLFRDPPRSGEVRCEVRFDGIFGTTDHPAFSIQMITETGVWLQMRLIEACFPKGPIGLSAPSSRRAFLRDKRFQGDVSLSQRQEGSTLLRVEDVAISDWFPGTIKAIYNTEDPVEIAVREHLAHKTHVHPSRVLEAMPLHHFSYEVSNQDGEVLVKDTAPEALDLTPVINYWTDWFGHEPWPVEDMYYGLMEQFIGRVIFDEPSSIEALRGKSALYLANHQIGVESLLFSILVSGLLELPTVTLAKIEHKETWLGTLITQCFQYPNITDPEVMTFFDRSDKASLPKIIGELGMQLMMGERSVMVHIEGTRSLTCRTPVQKMTGAFLDMAMQVNVPVVPVRFVGALPVEPLEARRDFPIGMAKQDIWLGRPIYPQELAALTYNDRKKLLIKSINDLAMPNGQEQPNPPNPAFEKEVDALFAQTGTDYGDATLMTVLKQRPNPCKDTKRLIDALETGKLEVSDKAEDQWLAKMAKRLIGTGKADT